MASSGASAYKLVMVVAVALLVLVAPPQVESAVTCGQVLNAVNPCVSYLQTGGKVPKACCDGVSGLVGGTTTAQDRQTACSCLKSVATGVPMVYVNRAAALPGKCGVKIPYKISPMTDCSKVK